ncbi:MAG TPA: hypothetical protein VGN32_16440 [Ktedonobacterales bacterium]|nr:hypothetical protein [Ktedonobacterales bacterium]
MRHLRHGTVMHYIMGTAFFLGLSVGLVACGVAPQLGASGSATAGAATQTASAHASATQTPLAGQSGGVSLTLNHSHYAATDAIAVTIHNGLSTAILTATDHSNCTVVSLERLMNGVWQVTAVCAGALPAPRVVSIASGDMLTQSLALRQGVAVADHTGSTWPAGLYRFMLLYVTDPHAPIAQGTAVYSATFTVA